ncbi:MAG: radical SAM protein [Ancalomicrobiaceae bacterium]|nr:radical SAM protein [Ancalomicrobiaceae bacterium]
MHLMPPRFLFLEVNKRCNLRCTHCDYWTRNDDDRAAYLSRQRRREVVAEFAEMSPHGSLVICGGESMLDIDDYFALCRDAREHGIHVLSVVNGTRIRSDEMADRMVLDGPHEISVSLNSHRKELHDKTRGVDGAFDKAVRAIRLLAAARDRHPEVKSRIVVMGLIFGSNYREIEDFYDFVLNDLGADTLKLNFLQPSFGQSGEIDPFFEVESLVDPTILMDQIDRSDARFALGLNPIWRAQVEMYFRSLGQIKDRIRGWGSAGKTTEHICNTYDRNIMVNHYGVARLCFSTGFRGVQLKQPGDLKAFWVESNDIRRRMRRCNQFCGISHSVRAESSTVVGRAKADTFRQESEPILAHRTLPAVLLEKLLSGVGL